MAIAGARCAFLDLDQDADRRCCRRSDEQRMTAASNMDPGHPKKSGPEGDVLVLRKRIESAVNGNLEFTRRPVQVKARARRYPDKGQDHEDRISPSREASLADVGTQVLCKR